MGDTISRHDLELAKDEAVGIQSRIVHPHQSLVHRACQHIHFPVYSLEEAEQLAIKPQDIALVVEQAESDAQQPTLNKCDDQYNECTAHFQLHQLDKASKIAGDLIEHYKASSICLQRLNFMEKIMSEQKLVDYYYGILHGQGWNFKGEKEGIRVSSRHEDGNSIGVLVEAPLNVPIEIFVAVVTQIDLFCRFVPFMKYSKQAKTISRNSKIGHTINDLPFISKRQAFFLGVGYDRLDYNNTVMLYTRSFTQNVELQSELGYIVKKTPGAVQLSYKYFVLEYTPITKTKGRISLAINVDMKLPAVPMFILDFACRNFGFEFISNILNISRKFEGSEWQQGLQKDPALFNFFRGRLQEYLDTTQPDSTQSKPIKTS